MTREETLLRRLAVEIESELASLAQLEQMPATLAAFRGQIEAFLAWMLGQLPA